MKKILIAKQSLAKTYSGACRSVHEEIRYLSKLGHEVHTISEDMNSEDIKKSGATPHKSFRWPWQKHYQRRMQFNKEAKKLANKLKADLVIGHGDYQSPNIHFIHNCVHLAHEKINQKELPKDNELYKIHTPILENNQFDHLVANSELTKNELITRFNIHPLNISVIYPAISREQFYPIDDNTKVKLKKELGLEKEELLVGLITSGNFKKRGVDRFFRAINLLPKEIAHKSTFIFVGKDKVSPEISSALSTSPYKERIKFLPVINDVQKYFWALDVFVLPARIEEFGRVVAEAMACGTPIITTKWVGASELMQGKSKSFIYDGENDQELTDLIVKLLENRELRKEVSNLNAKSIEEITEDNLSKKFDSLFKSYL